MKTSQIKGIVLMWIGFVIVIVSVVENYDTMMLYSGIFTCVAAFLLIFDLNDKIDNIL